MLKMNRIQGEFCVDDLFTIETPKLRINANTVIVHDEPKGHPYVVRTSQNNGIRGYIEFNEQYLNPANTISFGQDTATMFYQERPYFTGDKIKILTLKCDKLNYRTATYLLASMRKSFSLFSWGQSKFNVNAIGEVKFYLPILCESEKKKTYDLKDIDWNYMQERIRELEQERIRELEQERIQELELYLKATGLSSCILTYEDREILEKAEKIGKIKKGEVLRYENFKIGDLFEIATGRDLIIGKTTTGNIPLVSHQNSENGIVKYVSPVPDRRIFDHKNTIALADRGLFYATVQNQNFHIGTRVKALTLKGDIQAKEVLMFFVAAINKLQIQFTEYLTNATDKLPIQMIKLPVCLNVDGSPKIDFKYNYTILCFNLYSLMNQGIQN